MHDIIQGPSFIDVQRDILTNEFIMRVVLKVANVGFFACDEVIQANDLMTFIKKSFCQVGSEESRATGKENTHL
jgi:hypothetical protein